MHRTVRIGIMALAALAIGPAAHAGAASFVVDSVADSAAVDDPSDGVCDAQPGSAVECTLRAAIQEANGVAGMDTITLANLGPPFDLTIAGTDEDSAASGDLDLNESVNINGDAGVVIDAQGLDRVFQVGPEVGKEPDVKISLVDITGGGGVSAGGAILSSSGTLELDRVELYGNSADGGAGTGTGGAVWFESASPNVVSATTIVDNEARGDSFATAGGLGSAASAGPVTVINSTINSNRAVSALGGAQGGGIWAGAGVTLTQSTLDLNRAAGADPSSGGNVYGAGQAQVRLRGSVISDGQADSGENCAGAQLSQGANVEAGPLTPPGQCALSGALGDREVTDARLVPLGNRGGPTRTEALFDGSPALNAVPFCYPAVTDQRGFSRPSAFACDAGSFERQVTAPAGLCLGLRATIFGFSAGETIVGTPGNDVIVGMGGADVIKGLGGRDTICGGKGADRVRGAAGADRISGGAGDDTLYGEGGPDLLRGDAGHDVLIGGAGIDRLDGGAGRDRCKASGKDRTRRC